MSDMDDQPQIMVPRLGAHISAWGHGHTCDSPDQPHDGPCVCACGIPQPYDQWTQWYGFLSPGNA